MSKYGIAVIMMMFAIFLIACMGRIKMEKHYCHIPEPPRLEKDCQKDVIKLIEYINEIKILNKEK